MVFIRQDFFLSPSAAAAFLAANFFNLTLSFRTLLGNFFLKLFDEQAAGVKAVECLAARELAFNFNPARQVLQEYTGGGLVDVLSARAGRANKLFAEVLRPNTQAGHLIIELSLFVKGDYANR